MRRKKGGGVALRGSTCIIIAGEVGQESLSL